jgi:hypothetical protein
MGEENGTYKAITKEGAVSFFLQLGYIVHVPGAVLVGGIT